MVSGIVVMNATSLSIAPDSVLAADPSGEPGSGVPRDLTADLNQKQLEAVRHGHGPLLIFAGAGSGKTRVLTHRMANLVLEHNVHPEQILAVTFTNKAAQEMKHRVRELFRGQRAPTWVTTFHSWSAQMLRRHAELLEFTPNFAIYDTSDTTSALKRVYTRLGIDPRFLDPHMVRSRIDRAKNAYQFADTIRADRYIPEEFRIMIADVFEAYQAELKSSNAMDFGDLLCNLVTLFKLEPKLLEQYQDMIQHLLVDEYQDTNRVQYILVQMLAEKRRNICVVGDDDQSIYAFRGATVQNILNFKKDFPEAKVVTLDINYRSSRNILAAANAIIAKNKTRQKKSMSTTNPDGKHLTCFRAYDEQAEAEFIVREILAMSREGLSASDIAVFYRTNAQSRAVEEAFCEAGLPYEIFGGHKFYDRKEIKDILAYYRLLLNPDDNEAFLRVINTPTRGIGATSVAALVSYADKARLSLSAALKQGIETKAPFLSSSNRGKFSAFLQVLENLRSEAELAVAALTETGPDIALSTQITAIPNLLKEIAEQTSYLDRLKAEATPESEARMENIFELFGVALSFSERNFAEGTPPTLRDFLDRASLSSDLDAENTGSSKGEKVTGTVSLMTLHLCKGLEFAAVFLIGMEEGLLPHVRSLEDGPALEEERRLCYVGITRARKKLYLTRARSRQTYGRGSFMPGYPSRFIADLPRAILEDRQSGFLDW